MMSDVSARCVRQQRCETRMKVLLTGTLSVRGGTVACRIYDLSRGGACLEIAHRAPVGEMVKLTRGGLIAPGRIAWTRGRRMGVRFDVAIRATELLVQMSASRQAREALEGPRLIAPVAPISPSR